MTMLLRFVVLAAALTGSVTHAAEVGDDSFRCIRDMTPVRGFYVDNLNGDVAATVAAANAEGGANYPAGSVVQLVPGEAMVKHDAGFSPATRDWEFFELNVSAQGTTIGKRGFADVVNRFGGNCFACHVKAEPRWDMVCEQGHGCDPIPLTATMTRAIQKTDPRCATVALTAEEQEALQALQRAMAPKDADANGG